MDSQNSEKEKVETSGRSSVDDKDAHIIGINEGDSTTAVEEYSEAVLNYHIKTYLTVFAICLIYLSQAFNIVGSGALARDISSTVGGASQSVWLSSSITIANGVLALPFSQAADYWGRRWFLIIPTAAGAIGSLIVARANSMHMAIAGEVVAGLSYGAQPLLHAVASEVLRRKHRPQAQAAINTALALGGLLALVVGGALTLHKSDGFRNFWYISTAFYGVAAIMCFVLYNPPPRPSTHLSNSAKLAQLDWIGYVILTAGLVLFSMGLSWSQDPYSWSNAHILATFVTGLVFLIGFAAFEAWVKKDGIFHHDLFSRGRNFGISLLCIFVEGMVFIAANNYFVFEVTVLFQSNSLKAGIWYGITFIVYPISSVLSSYYSSRMKQIRGPVVVAFGFFIIFNICMATVTHGSANATWGYTVFLGIGLGMCLCCLITVAQLSTPPELIATASGLMIGVRALGSVVGIPIYNAIFTNKLSSNLGPKIAAAVLPLGLPQTLLPAFIGNLATGDTAALAKIQGVTPEMIAAGFRGQTDAYTIAFRYVWILGACFTTIAAIAALFLVDPVKEFTEHIDATVEKEAESMLPSP